MSGELRSSRCADTWNAVRASPVAGPLSIHDTTGEWHALRQAWLPGGPDAGFRAGSARITWTPSSLIFDAAFTGAGQSNDAVSLNQCTWELGDVCEVFVRAEESPFYLEIHITPENQRLQLRFPLGAIGEIRAGRADLADYFVADPKWVESWTRATDRHLLVRACVPAAVLGINRPLSPDVPLRAAVCRYDYGARTTAPVLSSTAALGEPFFHRHEEWSFLRLSSEVESATV